MTTEIATVVLNNGWRVLAHSHRGQIEAAKFSNGSHMVRSTRSIGPGHYWASRLYINDGETATLVCARHKTREGAERWAKKVLASPQAARDHAEKALAS